MRTLLGYLFRYVLVVILLFACLAGWMVYDGLHDQGDKADAALVIHPQEASLMKNASVHAGLDRAIKLYREQDISSIIVSSSTTSLDPGVEAEEMAKYLESKGIPADAIAVDRHGNDLLRRARDVAGIMTARGAQSLIIVADYYDIDPMKLALVHENLRQLGKAHVGSLQAQDAMDIARSEYDLCQYVGTVYLVPAAEKAKVEGQAAMQKASTEAEQAKKDVDQKLNSMSK